MGCGLAIELNPTWGILRMKSSERRVISRQLEPIVDKFALERARIQEKIKLLEEMEAQLAHNANFRKEILE